MKLPFADRVVIPREKLTDYLLSDTHPSGSSKAEVLLRFGFDPHKPDALEDVLRRLVLEYEIARIVPKSYGISYVVEGRIVTPNLRELKLRTVWIVLDNMSVPRFVTAYPLKDKPDVPIPRS